MNLRHGHLWQRLGLTIVSGIVATSYAPAALAAPVDEQGAQSDSSIADSQVSRSEEEAQSGSAAVDQTSARDADTAEAATASSEEKAEEGGSAQVLTFPGTSGPTRIHILSTAGAADAILLESRGVFAMIDGGEGVGAPDGSDPRYPWRDGIEGAAKGDTDWVFGYLRRNGVTSSNLAFYLGTHAHSDHIDNADDIIYKYRPKVILSPEYSDEWITDDNSLWDNQYVYDHLVTAANWAVDSYGATFIQRLDGYNTHIALGGADIQMIPFDADEYYKTRGTTDANLMGWGTKVTANGHTAFLAADLMSTESDWETPNGFEDRIADEVGEVDMLKAGHHGAESSNSIPFMQKLHPGAIIQTGMSDDSPDRLSFLVLHGDTKWFPMGDIRDSIKVPALICEFSGDGITYDGVSNSEWGHEYESETPRVWWFKAGRPAATTGWWDGPSGNRYYFNNSASAVVDQWLDVDSISYHFDATGALIEQKDADGNVTVVTTASSGSSATPIPSLWWFIAGGGALVVLAGGAVFLRRCKG